MSNATMFNIVHDLMVIKSFGVQCHPRKAPNIVEVEWHLPLQGWTECNTDGLCKSGVAASGALFRTSAGEVCGAFVQRIGEGMSYYAEFLALLIAVEITAAKGWRRVWFKVDSASALLNFFNKNYKRSW